MHAVLSVLDTMYFVLGRKLWVLSFCVFFRPQNANATEMAE